MYEYKSILLDTARNNSFNQYSINQLNKEFNEDWEYVNSISQTIAQGSTGTECTEYGPVIVIIRKKKKGVTL